MIITCPYCRKQHRLREGFHLSPNSAALCKGCGRRFLIESAETIPATDSQPDTQKQSATPDPAPQVSLAVDTPLFTGNQQPESTITATITEFLPDLRDLPPSGFVLADLFKSDSHGGYLGRLNRHKLKLLRATAPLLSSRILDKGETVHKIASGIAYFRFEIPYANGLLTWPLNYYALVATNQRLLLINLDYHLNHLGHYVFQISFSDIAGISQGFYGSSLIITTKSGRIWDFTTVKRALAKEMSEFIREKISPDSPPEPESNPPPQLCPHCFQPVPEKISSCPLCLTHYKSAGEAIKKSLFFPGLGVYSLSFTYLGVTEMLGYLMTWLLTISLVIIGIPGGIFGGGLLILAYHLMSAFMAGQMAAKGHIAQQQAPPDNEEFPDS
ncbi:MAG: hypothetical protein HGA96_16745 [Desulfobulbaceae bacterium]|nr:hypothetical protein [Desulfobulbaceae bacterium]